MGIACETARNVYVVDDDPSWCSFIKKLLSAHRYDVEIFFAGIDFVEVAKEKKPGCILLDMKMPHMNGVETLIELHARGVFMPVIFVTGHPSVESCVLAMKLGALDYLQKPVESEIILSAVDSGLALAGNRGKFDFDHGMLLRNYHQLTKREKEVLPLIMEGMTNAQVGEILFIAARTAKAHRASIMEKMQARNVIELSMMFSALIGLRKPN